MRYYMSGTEDDESESIITQYPAHLHINLLPGFQGQEIGTRLMNRFEDHMTDLGVKGLHLGTTNKNYKAVPFYQKMGFEIVQESEIVPHPFFDDLKHLVFAKRIRNSTTHV
jgi:ribosomal protein S18 acetylase RimI-like enzyme